MGDARVLARWALSHWAVELSGLASPAGRPLGAGTCRGVRGWECRATGSRELVAHQGNRRSFPEAPGVLVGEAFWAGSSLFLWFAIDLPLPSRMPWSISAAWYPGVCSVNWMLREPRSFLLVW